MLIDILFLVLLVLAVFKGLQRGLIVGVFSLLALVAGLAAAIKLSAVVAEKMQGTVHVPSKWMPVLAFVLVFVIVIFLVKWAAGLLKTAADFALLGWVDKLGGILLYSCIYIISYSVLLFYATQLHLLSRETLNTSACYAFIEPWGPVTINAIGRLLPFFKNMFVELENFFSSLA